MGYAKRTDANHAQIRDGLRKHGYIVLDMSGVGHGVPDLCVQDPRGRWPCFLQVKDPEQPPSKRRLTPPEIKWMDYCGWCTRVVLTLDEAVSAIREIRSLTKANP